MSFLGREEWQFLKIKITGRKEVVVEK